MNKKIGLGICMILISCIVTAYPTAYYNEKSLTYYENDSIINSSEIGYVDIDSGNDVLQYIRINISNTTNTNLLSNQAYKGSSAFYNRLFVQTNNSQEDTKFDIYDINKIGTIDVELDIFNSLGGKDISDNIVNNFTLTLKINSSQTLDANISIIFNKNTFGVNDAVNITSVDNGTILDGDNDGFNEKYNNSFTINNIQKTITINFSTKKGVNFNDLSNNIDEMFSISIINVRDGSFTSRNIDALFSRGSIKQKTDLIWQNNTWYVRGFLQNPSENLTYTIDSYELYDVSNLTDANYTEAVNANITPGTEFGSIWYVSGSLKPYYTAAFDWYVAWDTTIYNKIIESKAKLPILYVIDIDADKDVSIIQSTPERIVRVIDTVTHTGHESLEINQINILSVVPHESEQNTNTAWNITTFKIEYVNSTATVDITSLVNITIIQGNLTSDTSVFLNISNISTIIGRYFQKNEKIILTYNTTSPTASSTENYVFFGNDTATSLSGTPVLKQFPSQIDFMITPPITPTPPTEPGGGGGLICVPKYECSQWSKCSIYGKQTRICVDVKCGEEAKIEEQSCYYIPTCYDNVQNGEESGIDCGGNCGPCIYFIGDFNISDEYHYYPGIGEEWHFTFEGKDYFIIVYVIDDNLIVGTIFPIGTEFDLNLLEIKYFDPNEDNIPDMMLILEEMIDLQPRIRLQLLKACPTCPVPKFPLVIKEERAICSPAVLIFSFVLLRIIQLLLIVYILMFMQKQKKLWLLRWFRKFVALVLILLFLALLLFIGCEFAGLGCEFLVVLLLLLVLIYLVKKYKKEYEKIIEEEERKKRLKKFKTKINQLENRKKNLKILIRKSRTKQTLYLREMELKEIISKIKKLKK